MNWDEEALLGEKVEVLLHDGIVWSEPDFSIKDGADLREAKILRQDPEVVVRGTLLAFNEGGEIVILDENGFKNYCWPMLKVRKCTT